jgi:uncharacterized phage infection (PIP) family protein YhgE
MSEENNTGNNLIWAITTIIVVGIIALALFYSGVFSGATKPVKENTTINVTAPPAK